MSRSLEARIDGVRRAEKADLAWALSLVEDRRSGRAPELGALLGALPMRLESHRVGLTGPPGVGKSTLAAAMARAFRSAGKTVGVLAVDPSSPRSGGALLGDRVRMALDHTDPGLFVRSFATGGEAGGLMHAIDAAARVLGAAFDRVLIETTGVGQTETDIVYLADTVVLVIQPGSGDVLQFLKAGIMEVPDIVVVNKVDQGRLAEAAAADLRSALGATPRDLEHEWKVTVLRTSARDGTGIEELVDEVERHRSATHGGLMKRRRRGAVAWTLSLVTRRYGVYGIERLGGRRAAESLAEQFLDEGASPNEVALRLGERITG